jgi:hypothetical protein
MLHLTWLSSSGRKAHSLLPWLVFSGGVILVALLFGGGELALHRHKEDLRHQLAQLPPLQQQSPNRAYQLAQQVRERAIALGLDHEQGQATYWMARLDRDMSRFAQFFSRRAYRLATHAQQSFQAVRDPFWQAKTHLLQASILEIGLSEPAGGAVDAQAAAVQLKQAQEQIALLEETSRRQALEALWLRHRAVLLVHQHFSDTDSLFAAIRLLEKSQFLAQQAGDWESEAIAARVQGNVHEDLGRRFRKGVAKDTAAAYRQLAAGKQALERAEGLFQAHHDQTGLSNVASKQADLLELQWLLAPDSLHFALARNAYLANLHSSQPFRPGYQLTSLAQLHHWALFIMPAKQPDWQTICLDSANFYYERAAMAAIEEADLAQLKVVFSNWKKACDEAACRGRISALKDSALLMVPRMAAEIEAAVATEIREADLAAAQQEAAQSRRHLLLGLGLVLGLLGFGFALRWQRRQVQYLRSELQQSLQLAQAKMNPHFIGNTLNSIDSLINSGQAEKASKYLVRFSRLANAILQHADKPHISLHEEVRTLGHFLDLERLRLNERFEYELTVAESLPVHSLQLPPMLLQPLVENAIWHGLQPKISGLRAEGNLKVAFLAHPQDDRLLCCVVEDDGIGREKAREMQKNQPPRQRTSQSTALIQQRLQAMGYQATIEMEDLLDAEGQAAGTRVTLVLPRIFSPNL